MSDKITEAIGLIQQAITENTRIVHGQHCGCDVDFQTCDVCGKACEKELGWHEDGCFVGWLQDAVSILDDVTPNALAQAAGAPEFDETTGGRSGSPGAEGST